MCKISRKYLKLICSLIVFTLFGCQNSQNNTWQLVYKNDNLGNPIQGDKEDLLRAVRNGQPIRIGSGGTFKQDSTTMSIEHIYEAQFLTILNDEDVYAQLLPIIGQNPFMEPDSTNITYRKTKWSIMVGSNGFSDRLTTTIGQDSILSQNQRTMWVSWFAQKNQSTNPLPLWKK